MKVLLSIKPKYVERIFFGDKKYEYRKRIFTNKDIDTIIVYSTSPVKKIVGEFKIGNIIEDSPFEIWKTTKKHSGIDKEEYNKYFHGRDKGYAISIEKIEVYEKPVNLHEFNSKLKHPPQSFMYV